MSAVEFFVGGGGDKGDFGSKPSSPSHIMKDVKNRRQKIAPHIICEYRGHEEYELVLQEIKQKWRSREYRSIRLTGHSWGGQAVMDLAQALAQLSIPVDELITLDPVSMFPFGRIRIPAGKWINVYAKQSLLDRSIGKIPIIGNVVNAILTLPMAAVAADDYVANVGGQLGYENGAHNIEMNVRHRDAQVMYDKARIEIANAPTQPKAIGIR